MFHYSTHPKKEKLREYADIRGLVPNKWDDWKDFTWHAGATWNFKKWNSYVERVAKILTE